MNGFFLAFGEQSCVPTVAVRDRDWMKRRGYDIVGMTNRYTFARLF